MKKLREDLIHVAVRKFLKRKKWNLIAGQYPNGSDDELQALNIVDPSLAKDHSPDHRRHSKNKLVPDLLANRKNILLVIELKPVCDIKDEIKLEKILSDRGKDLHSSLKNFLSRKKVSLDEPLSKIIYIPCLGFSYPDSFKRNSKFCYFKVKDLSSVEFIGNNVLPFIDL